MSAERPEQTGAAVTSLDSNAAPGQILAAQREAMGWTVEQVADQLKLAVRQVVAIEAGDSAALPGPAVVRGFVRAYAKIVRLDPTPLVAKIALDTPGPSDATHTHLRHNKPASFSEVRFPTHGKRASLPIVPIVVALVAAGAIAAAWHFGLLAKLSNRADSTPVASNTVAAPIGMAPISTVPLAASAAASTGSAGTPLVTSNGAPASTSTSTGTTSSVQVQSLQNPTVPLISVPPPSTVSPGSPSAAVAGVPAAVAPAAATAADAGANALVIVVREDSWIQVKRAKGAPLISRLVKAGSTETFDITEPVTMVVGKPGAVSATLRGVAVALPATSGTAAKVSLK